MPAFAWVADSREPPWAWDLRRAGWNLLDHARREHVQLVDMRAPRRGAIEGPARALTIGIGVDCGAERASLLDSGWGDALPASVALPELAQRATRLAGSRDSVPRRRAAGPLVLDLLHRDAHTGERWLALHPREFELLWRLVERPGEPVSRARLLREVWRLEFDPGTNTVEVHVSRLRSKIAAAGAGRLIEKAPLGYRFALPGNARPNSPTACHPALSRPDFLLGRMPR